jgi:hypothetical protein
VYTLRQTAGINYVKDTDFDPVGLLISHQLINTAKALFCPMAFAEITDVSGRNKRF